VQFALERASKANFAAVRADLHAGEVARLTAQVADDERLLADLGAMLGARQIRQGEWLAARAPIDARLKAARQRLGARGGSALPEVASIDEQVWSSLSFDQRREVISLFVDRVVVAKASGSGRWDPSRLTLVPRIVG
jgi:hypothetical protein